MRKVYFSKNIKDIQIDELPADTLVVVHEMYDKPDIDRKTIGWREFKAIYSELTTSQYVIVGVNRMINPSNRCDMVNDFLQVMTKSVPKIVIDTEPFIGEPWRVWYHYSVAFGEWMGTDYSYPIEGEWQKWFFYEKNSCRLSGDNIKFFIKNTESDIPPLNNEFKLYQLSDIHYQHYEEVKNIVFEKYNTPKLLANNLLKLMNKHLGLDFGIDSYKENKSFLLPDVGVYQYFIEENRRRQGIYNCFAKKIDL